jgi:hydrogenase maturation protein HypF
LNTATTHAAGRLFDSVAVFLGAAAGAITYEGQPAIRLEALARSCADANVPALPYDLMEDGGMLWVDWRPLWRALPELRAARREAARWALAFHEAVARAAADMVRYAASQVPRRRTLALSGGVMMNRIVTERLAALLAPSGLEVCLPRQVPPGDGGIALGQAVIAGG